MHWPPQVPSGMEPSSQPHGCLDYDQRHPYSIITDGPLFALYSEPHPGSWHVVSWTCHFLFLQLLMWIVAASILFTLSYSQLMFSLFSSVILQPISDFLGQSFIALIIFCVTSHLFPIMLQPIPRLRAAHNCAWFEVIIQPVPPLSGPLAHSCIPLKCSRIMAIHSQAIW